MRKVIVLLSLSTSIFGDSLDASIDRFFHQFNTDDPLLETEPIEVHVPRYRGSGSIDFIEGGHSAANGPRMKEALFTQLTQGTVYKFLVGLETVSPLLASS